MGEAETITVAEVSEGEDAGTAVELPVVELLTGRAFLTGKSGSGKSNTASVVAEKLLDRGYSLLLVDIEGEYYGLKEEYEILHAGADEECDIQVREEHAGKLASLALEQNVPIILDLSGFLHESDARDLLMAVARQLFAKEKKLKQPFLMVVEEIHEYVPEGGGMDECGRMLVKVAKRGRKHGLGVAGISQRPADVKKDFITQCDWLVWHRLTWQNDTRVVKRVLGAEYADAIEDMGDGEGFLMTDWGEQIRRIQFHRKETFDAGATPGLDDFERPDLKSVSEDLVSELQSISEEQAAREDDVARLETELAEREQRIGELKEELAEARDLSDMAEQFARAMSAQTGPTHDTPAQRDVHAFTNGGAAAGDGDEDDETAERLGVAKEPADDYDDLAEVDADTAGGTVDHADADADTAAGTDEPADPADTDEEPPAIDIDLPDEQQAIVREAAAANQEGVGEVTIPPGVTDARDEAPEKRPSCDDDPESVVDGEPDAQGEGSGEVQSIAVGRNGHHASDDGTTEPQADEETTRSASDGDVTGRGDGNVASSETADAGDGMMDAEEDTDAGDEPLFGTGEGFLSGDEGGADKSVGTTDPGTDQGNPGSAPAVGGGGPEDVAASLRERVTELDPVARRMLASYRDSGVATPEAVHAAAGASGERPAAYGLNRELRRAGFVVHVGGGRYAYALPSLVAARTDGDLDDDQRRQLVAEAEAALDW